MRTSIGKMAKSAWVVLVLFGSAAMTVAGLVLALDGGDQPYKTVNLKPLRHLSAQMNTVEGSDGESYRIVFLGDSLSLGSGGFTRAQQWVPTQLGKILESRTRSREEVEVVPLVWTGLSIFSYYFMSDRVIATEPDDVIVQFDLFWLSESWHRKLDRTVLSALLPLSSLREAVTLPLHVSSLTTDRWILYRALFSLGLLDAWEWVQREQARLPGAYWNLAEWTQVSVGVPTGLAYRNIHRQRFANSSVDDRGRATLRTARDLMGEALDGADADHFALVMLDALLGRFANANIPALVFVPPHNVEHLAELGILDREGLDQTLARIRDVAQHRGARFIDLHDLFPAAGFRDYLDHFVDEPGREGSKLIARELAPEVLRTYEIRRPTGR